MVGPTGLNDAFRLGYHPPQSRNDEEIVMTQTTQERNKAFVLEAFYTLFNKRNDVVAERYWSPNYIQDQATQQQSKSGRPMYGDSFPVYR